MRFCAVALLSLCEIAFAGGAHAEERSYRFEWQGADGYRIVGAMSYLHSAKTRALVFADDVTCFQIEGFHNDAPIGRWALTMLNPDTSWRLHFAPNGPFFVHDGMGFDMPQAWNMNGSGDDCGNGGFGFNVGNLGQDICIDNDFVIESRVPPQKPLPAIRDDDFSFAADACIGAIVIGQLSQPAAEVAALP